MLKKRPHYFLGTPIVFLALVRWVYDQAANILLLEFVASNKFTTLIRHAFHQQDPNGASCSLIEKDNQIYNDGQILSPNSVRHFNKHTIVLQKIVMPVVSH